MNGRKFDGDGLKNAIKAAAGHGAAPELLIHDGDVYRTVKLDWHGGLRYPQLEKVGTGRARSTRCLLRADADKGDSMRMLLIAAAMALRCRYRRQRRRRRPPRAMSGSRSSESRASTRSSIR